MKFTQEILIQQPVQKVVELFDNPDNLKHWQPGLLSFEHLSGTPGQPGAKSRLKYQMGKRQIEMVETVVRRNLPEEFSGTYEAQGVVNSITNRFVSEGNATKYITENEFRFSGFLKVIGFLMPGAFKKQNMKFMQDFKTFCEGRKS